MPDKKLTEELLNELLDAPSIEAISKSTTLPPRRFRSI